VIEADYSLLLKVIQIGGVQNFIGIGPSFFEVNSVIIKVILPTG